MNRRIATCLTLVLLAPCLWAQDTTNLDTTNLDQTVAPTKNLIEAPSSRWKYWNPDSAESLDDGVIRVTNGVIETNAFAVRPHSLVRVSARMRGEHVALQGESKNWHGVRMTLSFWDDSGKQRIKHHEVMIARGAFGWGRPVQEYIVPEQAATARLTFQLTHATGVFFVDEIEARVVSTLEEMKSRAAEKKRDAVVICPHPAEMKTSSVKTMTTTFRQIKIPQHDTRLAKWIESYSPLVKRGDGAVLMFEQAADQSRDQGYRLVAKDGEVRISARTEIGRFYGLQSLIQLVAKRERMTEIEIKDHPTMVRRGIPVGFHWFRQTDKLVRRMSALKINFVWTTGSYLNEKFRYRWREPLNESESDALARYISKMQASFIEPAICLAPRGKSASEATIYGSASEVNAVLQRFRQLSELGVQEFGMTFDDLQNTEQHRLYGADVGQFDNDIGRAQVHFTNSVWRGLKKIDANARLTVCILYYGQISSPAPGPNQYYDALAKLDAEIQLYSSPTNPISAEKVTRRTGRRHLVWDNFWSHRYGNVPAPDVVLPLLREPLDAKQVTGYTFLPLIPRMEDTSLISWQTGADYMWAPDRYNASESFARAIQHAE